MPRRYQDDPRRVLMEPFQGTTLQRLGYLAGAFYPPCDADAKTLIPVYRALYEEGLTIARSPQELKTVDTLLVQLESAQFGNSEALKRAGQREGERFQRSLPPN